MQELRVLVIDDEEDDRRALEDRLVTLRADVTVSITHATHHAEAIEHLERTAFDVVYTDLLLPPEGTTVGPGFTVCEADSEERRFTGEDWHSWVVSEGGVDIVRRTRTLPGRNLRVPMIVMTGFVETMPYARITRRLGYPDDPRLVLLPKFASVEKLSLKPAARVGPGIAEDLRHALGLSLRPTWDLTHAARVSEAAEQIRSRYRQGLRRVRIAQWREPDDAEDAPPRFTPGREVTCTLRLEIDPGTDVESIVRLLGEASGESELSVLYDDWPRLRDHVLLNPAVGVKVWLRVEFLDEQDHDPVDIELSELETGPSTGHGFSEEASQALRRMLMQRLILVFLAASTEPPFELEEGWGATPRDLMRIARDPDALAPPSGPWGTSRTPFDRSSLLADIEEAEGIRDRTDELTVLLKGRIREEKLFFDAEAIIASVGDKNNPRWSFNGGLELELREERWTRPRGTGRQRVAFFALADEVSFACLDGRLVAVDELALRFRNAGMHVKRFSAIEEARSLSEGLPDATLAVIAPVDEARLDSFIDGEAGRVWREAAACAGPLPPAILVLKDGVSVRSPEEMRRLRLLGVDCMYPTQQKDALDLTKIMDHVICAGYRTRYKPISEPEEDAPDVRAGGRVRFTWAFEQLRARGYDGDSMSGAASERISGGKILVTSSKTDKHSADPDDVAIANDVDFIGNIVRWSGRRRPSSSIRWHWLIYRRWPWARCILHTHWKALTYDRGFEQQRTCRYHLSGSRMEAADLVQVLDVEPDNEAGFGILRDHGEVFVASSWERLFTLVDETLERT